MPWTLLLAILLGASGGSLVGSMRTHHGDNRRLLAVSLLLAAGILA